MALHEFFEKSADNKARFHAGFEAWYDRTRANLATLAEDPKAFNWGGPFDVKQIKAAVEDKKLKDVSKEDALVTIMGVRERISRRVGSSLQGVEKYYGPQGALIAINTNMLINDLPPGKKAVLLEHFDLVAKLSEGAPDVISMAAEIEKKGAAQSFIGPSLPVQQEQFSVPAAQMH